MILIFWYNVYYFYFFQFLLSYGFWVDVKELSGGGGQWVDYFCLGQESFIFFECFRLRDVWFVVVGDYILEWFIVRFLFYLFSIFIQILFLFRSFQMKIRRFKELNEWLVFIVYFLFLCRILVSFIISFIGFWLE